MRLKDSMKKRSSARTRNIWIGLFLSTMFLFVMLIDHFGVGSPGNPVSPIEITLGRSNDKEHMTHLIVVAGHTTFQGLDYSAALDEDNWFLLPYQSGQLLSYLAHIQAGVELAAKDNTSLLLFSGGETRAEAGPRSEAESYWYYADAQDWFGHSQVRARAFTEEFARDSFENLLFSLCRYHDIVGWYPQKVTVISFSFKEDRFVHLHRTALRIPEDMFEFVAVDGPSDVPSLRQNWERDHGSKPPVLGGSIFTATDLKELHEAEANNAGNLFRVDPYGCQGSLLEKKSERDPFSRSVPYPKGCPEMSKLLSYCGTKVYKGRVPWRPGRSRT
eukprot:Rmarinus@m.5543